MNDELIETLAKRLLAVSYPRDQGQTYHWIPEWEDYRDAARECVRQMEWARRKCVDLVWEDYDDCQLDYSDPLTLAPEDWTP